MNKTPVEYLRSQFDDLDYQTCRNQLGRYGLEGHAHEVTMRDLSGGQKARVVFVDLSLQMPHLLLLDEREYYYFWCGKCSNWLVFTFNHLILLLLFCTLINAATNNLDIETIDALCDAINEFNGGIIVVTHDQRLIEECDCTLWVVEKQGVTEWKEGFDDYKENILRELEEQVEREAKVRQEKIVAAAAAKADKLARLAKKVKK